MIRILAAAAAVAVAAFIASEFLVSGKHDWQTVRDARITASAITPDAFSLSDDDTQFGSLRFVGGLVLRSSNPHFGALSGLRISNGGTLTAVTDTGFWFQGKVERDAEGVPSGIADGRMAPLLDGEGKPFSQKWFGDAEGLTFKNGKAYVSTEQDARVLEYDASSDLLTSSSKVFGPPLPGFRLPYNRGLEAIATIPEGHPRAGYLMAISETRLALGEHIRAFLISQQSIDEIAFLPRNDFSITDAEFLANGKLLLLERRFTPASGPALGIRMIDASASNEKPWELVSAFQDTILLSLGPRWQIDNMEGLSVFRTPDGSTRIGLVSDNNHWPLQRTLYLEFALGN